MRTGFHYLTNVGLRSMIQYKLNAKISHILTSSS